MVWVTKVTRLAFRRRLCGWEGAGWSSFQRFIGYLCVRVHAAVFLNQTWEHTHCLYCYPLFLTYYFMSVVWKLVIVFKAIHFLKVCEQAHILSRLLLKKDHGVWGQADMEGNAIPFIWHVGDRQVCRDRGKAGGCQGLGEVKWGTPAYRGQIFFWGDKNTL